MINVWGCPFCTWICTAASGGFDYGLIVAHLHDYHREEGDGLYPRELLQGVSRTGFTCPFPAETHYRGRPWIVTWCDDGTENIDPLEGNPHWAGMPDIGLEVIAQHMEAMHPEAIYGPLVPAGVLTKLRRGGARGSPGVRVEG